MSLSQQQSLLDTERSGALTLETNGRIIRPLLDVPSKLVDECKIRINEDGLSIRAVDPANVGLVEIEAPANAFEDYQLEGDDELVVGVNLSKLRSVLSDARMRAHDPDVVRIRLGTSVISAEIEREYVDTTVVRTDEFLAIDSDSIRGEPDLPDLDLPWSATMDTRALSETVAHLGKLYNHIRLFASGDGLELSAMGERDGDDNLTEAANAVIEAEMDNPGDDEESVTSIYSSDYLTDVVAGVKASKADTVSVDLGDEFPAVFEFERVDEDELIYSGEYAVAPRIEGSD